MKIEDIKPWYKGNCYLEYIEENTLPKPSSVKNEEEWKKLLKNVAKLYERGQ